MQRSHPGLFFKLLKFLNRDFAECATSRSRAAPPAPSAPDELWALETVSLRSPSSAWREGGRVHRLSGPGDDDERSEVVLAERHSL